MNITARCILLPCALILLGPALHGLEIKGFKPDQRIAYKETTTQSGDPVTLHLNVFEPDDHQASDQRPAIVFFFGGGWVGGSPSQFYPHCQHLAERGMVAISAEYRTKSGHGTDPRACVLDGKSAIRYIRQHAKSLGIDPDRIAAGGGSAGGHVAAATGTLTQFDEPGEDADISSKPNALVLYNPVFDNGPDGYGHQRVKAYWKDFSPMHNIDSSTPPTIVFLGTKDHHIPVATAKKYQSLMKKAERRCVLHLYENQPHGFFNYGKSSKKRDSPDHYQITTKHLDSFLSSLGWITE